MVTDFHNAICSLEILVTFTSATQMSACVETRYAIAPTCHTPMYNVDTCVATRDDVTTTSHTYLSDVDTCIETRHAVATACHTFVANVHLKCEIHHASHSESEVSLLYENKILN